MPKNLNALIRYKTLDKCLANPHRKWRIGDLVEACSEALRESQGIDSGVSERTIRDDIRVMRSDIMGFNAPIKQRLGNYWYSDPTYSIFGVSVEGRALLERILAFITDIREEVKHPGMEEIIRKLKEALSSEPDIEADIIVMDTNEKIVKSVKAAPDQLESAAFQDSAPSPYAFLWSELLELTGNH